jgi:hydroxymethylpyrimidine/phosphomethylpyrimidine kinase
MSRARRAAPVVLVVGGLDPTAGAGIAADVRTLESLRVASAVAVTAVTVQNGREVLRVVPVAPALLGEQIDAVLSSLPVAAVKCGMLATAKAVAVVADRIGDRIPLVLDPVLRSSGGQPLASRSMMAALRSKLLPNAAVVTPNLAEASALIGMPVEDVESMAEAARRILMLGPGAVVIKGGHLKGAPVDVLAVGRRVELLRGPRIVTGDMHGTGCAFASALAAGLARGRSVRASVAEARRHVRSLITRAQRLPNGAIIRRS